MACALAAGQDHLVNRLLAGFCGKAAGRPHAAPLHGSRPSLAGAWAALHALAVIDAGPAEVQAPAINAALIVGLPDPAIDFESRPPHPLCGCLWPETGSGSARRRLAG